MPFTCHPALLARAQEPTESQQLQHVEAFHPLPTDHTELCPCPSLLSLIMPLLDKGRGEMAPAPGAERKDWNVLERTEELQSKD